MIKINEKREDRTTKRIFLVKDILNEECCLCDEYESGSEIFIRKDVELSNDYVDQLKKR